MKDNLKHFIETHREGFDTLEPRELWTIISAGLIAPSQSFIHLKKFKNMFKYGFGASALIIGSFFILTSLFKSKTNKTSVEMVSRPSTPSILMEEKKTEAITKIETEVSKPVSSVKLEKPINIPKEKSTFQSLYSNTSSNQETVLNNPQTPMNTYAMVSHPANTVKTRSDTNASWQILDTVLKGVKNLIVKGHHCSVSVNGKDRKDVSFKGNTSFINGTIKVGFNSPRKTTEKIKFSLEDSTLTVWILTYKLAKGENRKEKTKEDKGLHFEVPIHTHVTIENHGDDIEVSNIVDSKLTLSTGYGKITAQNITAELDINSTSGDIALTNIDGKIHTISKFGNQNIKDVKGNINLVSSSGDVAVKNYKGNADVTTSFGNQKFESITGNITSKAKSGDITILTMNGDLSIGSSFGNQRIKNVIGNISAKASSGDIRLDEVKGILNLETSFGNITGKQVDLLKSSNFTTSSGDIQLEFLNEASQLSYDLTTSSGDLEINKGEAHAKSDKKLKIEKGPILVKGVSSFGNQKYR